MREMHRGNAGGEWRHTAGECDGYTGHATGKCDGCSVIFTGKRAGDIGYAGCHTGTAVRRSAAEYNRNVTGKCIRRIAGKCSAVIWGKCSAVIRGECFGYAAGDSARGTLREYTLTLTDKTGNVIISMGKGIGRVHNRQKTMQGYK